MDSSNKTIVRVKSKVLGGLLFEFDRATGTLCIVKRGVVHKVTLAELNSASVTLVVHPHQVEPRNKQNP